MAKKPTTPNNTNALTELTRDLEDLRGQYQGRAKKDSDDVQIFMAEKCQLMRKICGHYPDLQPIAEELEKLESSDPKLLIDLSKFEDVADAIDTLLQQRLSHISGTVRANAKNAMNVTYEDSNIRVIFNKIKSKNARAIAEHLIKKYQNPSVGHLLNLCIDNDLLDVPGMPRTKAAAQKMQNEIYDLCLEHLGITTTPSTPSAPTKTSTAPATPAASASAPVAPVAPVAPTVAPSAPATTPSASTPAPATPTAPPGAAAPSTSTPPASATTPSAAPGAATSATPAAPATPTAASAPTAPSTTPTPPSPAPAPAAPAPTPTSPTTPAAPNIAPHDWKFQPTGLPQDLLDEGYRTGKQVRTTQNVFDPKHPSNKSPSATQGTIGTVQAFGKFDGDASGRTYFQIEGTARGSKGAKPRFYAPRESVVLVRQPGAGAAIGSTMSAMRNNWFKIIAATGIAYGLGEWDPTRLSGDALLDDTTIEEVDSEERTLRITLPEGEILNRTAIIRGGIPGEDKYLLGEIGTLRSEKTNVYILTLDEDYIEKGGKLEFEAESRKEGKEPSGSTEVKSVHVDPID